MKTVCIIPARGGSKRIPRKNIRPLLGVPIIARAINTARMAGCFDEIMVSTDDPEIAAVARDAGAKVPFSRTVATSGDHASTAAVMVEVLDQYAANGRSFEVVCCLYATAALLAPERLRIASRMLQEDRRLDTVMSVQTYPHPIERAFRLADGLLAPLSELQQSVRTQDLQPAYHDAGQFYFFRPDGVRERGRMVGSRCSPVILDRWEVADLDDEADFVWLEKLMRTEATT